MNFYEIVSSVSDSVSSRFELLAKRCNAERWRENHEYLSVNSSPEETKLDSEFPGDSRLRRWNAGLQCDHCEQIIARGLRGVPCIAPYITISEFLSDSPECSYPYINQTTINTGISLTMPPDENGDRVVSFSATGYNGGNENPNTEIENAINSLASVETEFERLLRQFADQDTEAYRSLFERRENWLMSMWNHAIHRRPA